MNKRETWALRGCPWSKTLQMHCVPRDRFSSCPVHDRLKDGAPTDLWNRTHVVLCPGTTRFLEHTFICSSCSLCVDTIFWQLNFERSLSLTSIMDDSDDSSVIRQLIATQGSQVWRKTNQHILQHVRAKNKILVTNYFLPFFWDNSLWSTGDILVIPAIDYLNTKVVLSNSMLRTSIN